MDDGLLVRLVAEEQELVFARFTSDDALAIGLAIVEAAKARGVSIACDISRSGQQLFHWSSDGCAPDHDLWLQRKTRVVQRFHMSSAQLGERLRTTGLSLETRYGVSFADYAPAGGAFPIRIRGVGVVGAVAVSGLSREEDHALVTDAIRAHLVRTGTQ